MRINVLIIRETLWMVVIMDKAILVIDMPSCCNECSLMVKDEYSYYCPVKCEVLNSIFYEGTPLHDGALIIRGAMIEAAHVFVTPTTRALQGHYGARHRAAIGISEVTDALIIVVSEETGRISFVEHGDLETISRDRFTQALSDKIATL